MATDSTLQVPMTQLLERLHTSPGGLSEEKAAQRLAENGPNEIIEQRTPVLLEFLSYLWGPIPWMIEIAAILSAVVGEWSEFTIISALLLMNALVGFWEEYQAGNTVAALKAKLAHVARVHRDGQWKQVPSRDLVSGDVIRVRLGDVVPADARLLGGDPITIDQSALTGESMPVTRETGGTVYSGSIIRQGETDAVVIATGAGSYFGRTAELVRDTRTTSHFQKTIMKIGDYLIGLALVLVIVILTVSVFRGQPIMTTLQFALILTVAAIPVALPTVLSVTMAVGARKLSRDNAIVTHLASVEELAGIDVLCCDKTGTLTENRLTLGDPFVVDGVSTEEVFDAAALASRAEDQDPIDAAVLAGAGTNGLQTAEILDFLPFDPINKRTEATVRRDGRDFSVTKGAPQVVLALADDRLDVEDVVEKAIRQFAGRGYRSLGVARSDNGRRWRFLGVIPLFDPPREDSRKTLAAAQAMGLQVKMVTGDQQAIAEETAARLELGTRIEEVSLLSDIVDDDTVTRIVEHADGFAQVLPWHKHRIVDLLQKNDHRVGMTGDGVNDAPALKKADVGVAVSGATDAARDAADIVLLSPGLSIIVDAIKEARRIFQRMKSYAIYRIAETIRVLFFMTLSILAFNFYPVTAVMIVLLALLNDGAILSIAYDRATYGLRPERWNLPVVLTVATSMGLMGVLSSFGLFYVADRLYQLDRQTIQTLIYLKLSVAGHLTIFLTRTEGPFWKSRPSWILFLAVFGTQVGATLIAVYGLLMPALGWRWAMIVWGYALAWFVVNDFVKQGAYRLASTGLLRPARDAGGEGR